MLGGFVAQELGLCSLSSRDSSLTLRKERTIFVFHQLWNVWRIAGAQENREEMCPGLAAAMMGMGRSAVWGRASTHPVMNASVLGTLAEGWWGLTWAHCFLRKSWLLCPGLLSDVTQ